jgi:hypothetical protein
VPDTPHEDEERPELELVPPPNAATWRRERIGWVVLAAALVAALLGVFGGGPLSRAEVSAGALRLAYDRFVRVSSPTTLRLTLPPPTGSDREAVVFLDAAYVARVRLQSVVPQPKRSVTRPGSVEFVFEVVSVGSPATAWFHLTVEKSGWSSGRLTAGGATLEFHQLAYP